MINLDNAKELFKKYVKNYDVNNPKIALKIAHTYRVTDLAKQVSATLYNGEGSEKNKNIKFESKNIFLNEENIKLSELIGLLHDIGRFEQVKRYNSFLDRKTIDHAELGIKILTENDNELLNEFCPENKFHKTIITAIKNHNKYKITNILDENMLMQCKIIRDSDKIDILNLCRYESFETLYNKKDISNEEISDIVFDSFLNNIQIERSKIKTDMDGWLLDIGMIFDIYYKESFKILKEKNYIEKLFDRVTTSNNIKKIERLRETANRYIIKKCEEV